MVKRIRCIATGAIHGVTSYGVDGITQGKVYDLLAQNDKYYTFTDDKGVKRTTFKERFVIVPESRITGYITKHSLPEIPARTIGKLVDGWVEFGESDDTTYSQEFCSSNVHWFQPITEQENVILYLGSKSIKIIISKEGVICNDKKIDVNVLRTIVANSKSSSFEVGGYPIVYVTLEHRGFRIGCVTEDNRFSINDMEEVIKAYNEVNS